MRGGDNRDSIKTKRVQVLHSHSATQRFLFFFSIAYQRLVTHIHNKSRDIKKEYFVDYTRGSEQNERSSKRGRKKWGGRESKIRRELHDEKKKTKKKQKEVEKFFMECDVKELSKRLVVHRVTVTLSQQIGSLPRASVFHKYQGVQIFFVLSFESTRVKRLEYEIGE